MGALAKIFSFWAAYPGLVLDAALIVLSLRPPARPQASQSDLTKMVIKDLMNVKVTSVSRREQSLSLTAAAVLVITAKDIRHSGSRNIPEFLRILPGVQVAPSRQFDWDTSVSFVDRLVSPSIASYTRLDSGLTWKWKDHLSLSLFGQNLLQDHHLEFQDFTQSINSSLMKRSAYAKIAWHF